MSEKKLKPICASAVAVTAAGVFETVISVDVDDVDAAGGFAAGRRFLAGWVRGRIGGSMPCVTGDTSISR